MVTVFECDGIFDSVSIHGVISIGRGKILCFCVV